MGITWAKQGPLQKNGVAQNTVDPTRHDYRLYAYDKQGHLVGPPVTIFALTMKPQSTMRRGIVMAHVLKLLAGGRKTGRRVKFELTEQTRQAIEDYLRASGRKTRRIHVAPPIAGEQSDAEPMLLVGPAPSI